MPRYAMLIEYDGEDFCGWQRQENGPTVQQACEEALISLHPGQRSITLFGAGRTDSGVHAIGQLAHVDLDREWPGDRLAGAMNASLGSQRVTILRAGRVAEDFHARFDATCRSYRYRILSRPTRPSLRVRQLWWLARRLDVKRMAGAANMLVGQHDFTSYRSARCQAESAVRELDQLRVAEEGDEIHICCSARSFLHNQVRIITGSLVRVGDGSWPEHRLREILKLRDRRSAGPTAPAHGLTLMGVEYPAGTLPFTTQSAWPPGR